GVTGQGGSGMYYVQSVTTPEAGRTRVVLKANPNWWGLRAGRHPHLTEIDWTYFSAVDAAYSQYAAGLYAVGYPTPTTLASARTQRDFHQALTLDSLGVFMGWDQPPLDNPDARIALCLAIDRDALNQSAFGGARMPTWHLVPQGMPGYNGDLTGPDGVTNIHGDAARAQAHWQAYLRTLGGAPPASMGLPYLLGSAVQDAEAHALQQQWQTVLGVYVILVGYSSSPPRTTPNLGQPLALADWSLDYPDPQDILSGLLDPTSPYNVEHINYPAAATLVQQADMSADAAQRLAMYNQAEQLYINQAAWCPLAQSAVRYQVRSWVRGWTLDAAGIPANDAWIATYLVAH
ncbi:MAG TPA: ABC transporter substrate-binding protein, partial [Ktedonobacterales bacterium]